MQRSLYQSLPSNPGVYLFKNDKGKIIYVGKAKDLKKRVSSYFTNKYLDNKTVKLVEQIATIDHILVNSEIEAFLLEAALIKKYDPFYNIKLSDDKFYPFVKITHDEIPSIYITRKVIKDNAEYYGPYTSATDLKAVLKLIRHIFPYQSVKNHAKRKCLYYHLHLCPCIPVFPENLIQYKKNIKKIEHFLEGKKDVVIRDLRKEQQACIKSEEFEKAADIQKKIEQIEFITSDVYDPFQYTQRPNLYYERIEKEVESLRTILNQNGFSIEKLDRIECYDISNFQGKLATGSMVVFIKGEAYKKDYRRFRIKTKHTPDDFLMHREVMARRLRNSQWTYPDLFVIDGGKGQVSSVMSVMKQYGLDIPVIGLAKREEIIVIPYPTYNNHYDFLEVNLPNETPGINLLRRLRDEAHRFAITYHRLLRKKNLERI